MIYALGFATLIILLLTSSFNAKISNLIVSLKSHEKDDGQIKRIDELKSKFGKSSVMIYLLELIPFIIYIISLFID